MLFRVGYCYLLAVVPPFVCHVDDGQSLNKTICKANIENAAGSPAQPSQPSPAQPSLAVMPKLIQICLFK